MSDIGVKTLGSKNYLTSSVKGNKSPFPQTLLIFLGFRLLNHSSYTTLN